VIDLHRAQRRLLGDVDGHKLHEGRNLGVAAAVHFLLLFDETIVNAGTDADGVNADHLRFPLLDELHRDAGDFHRVAAALDANLLDIRPGPQQEDGSVVTKTRDVNSEPALSALYVAFALDGRLDQVQGD
jgi:hypothetical protein